MMGEYWVPKYKWQLVGEIKKMYPEMGRELERMEKGELMKIFLYERKIRIRGIMYKKVSKGEMRKMQILKIIEQNRRDFIAIYICEHCEHRVEKSGYDDTNFHKNVIPEMTCYACGKRASSTYRPLTTRYPDSFVI